MCVRVFAQVCFYYCFFFFTVCRNSDGRVERRQFPTHLSIRNKVSRTRQNELILSSANKPVSRLAVSRGSQRSLDTWTLREQVPANKPDNASTRLSLHRPVKSFRFNEVTVTDKARRVPRPAKNRKIHSFSRENGQKTRGSDAASRGGSSDGSYSVYEAEYAARPLHRRGLCRMVSRREKPWPSRRSY